MSFCVSCFSVAPFAPLLKYTCYMCNRQGAHKSDRISSSLCSHDNALLYLYWYLHFMLIWPWCILSYVWWEAIKLFRILNLELICHRQSLNPFMPFRCNKVCINIILTTLIGWLKYNNTACRRGPSQNKDHNVMQKLKLLESNYVYSLLYAKVSRLRLPMTMFRWK